MNTAKPLKIRVNDYLQAELINKIKSEYMNGDVYTMTDEKQSHEVIRLNLSSILSNHLQETPCQVYNSNIKVGIVTDNNHCFYYPDLHVSCEKSDNERYHVEPRLIIEVLSDSTERKDRAEKFYDYRKLSTLEEYVLIAQDCKRVEVYHRHENWNLALFGDDDKCYLNSIGLNLNVADIYQNVGLD